MKVATLEKFYLRWGGIKILGTQGWEKLGGGGNCENCSRLRMKTLQWCRWRRSSVIIVNCEHISNFVLIVDFEQANFFWVQIEKANTFEGKIAYIMHYVVVYFRWQQNLPTNIIWSYTIAFQGVSRLQTLILVKKMPLTYTMTCCAFVFLQNLLARRLIRLTWHNWFKLL